jgi:uncharacterized membrane protein
MVLSPEVAMSRSRSIVVAAALAAALSLVNIITALVLLPQGSDKVNSSNNQPPYAVVMITVVVGAIGLVSAYAAFRRQRWGVLVTLLLMILNVLLNLPGIPFGPTLLDKVSSAGGAIVAGAVIWLLLRRDSRVAVAAAAV